MKSLVIFSLFIFKVFGVQWSPDDPRWNDIPNWWDEENFVPPEAPTEEKSQQFWIENGQKILNQKINQKFNFNKAKNLIIFVGDGMGISTQTSTRSFLGDESFELSFEKFPFSGLSKTYCANYKTGDSSCTATAILSGVKINYGVVNLEANVNLRNCSGEQDPTTHVDSMIFKYAQKAKKSTGIVTNTRVTHATPAAAYAKSASRYWESDENTPNGCVDIADQLIHGEIGSNLDVILGGGRRHFFPNFTSIDGQFGFRTDSRNLLNEFEVENTRRRNNFAVISNRNELRNIEASKIDKLLGIFSHSHMAYELMKSEDSTEPSLSEMTLKAIEILSKNENGFVLLVEGGRIDHGHHETRAQRALSETVEFERAVEHAKNATNDEETLIIVTADHGHVFTVGGYTPRQRNILGVGDFSYIDGKWMFTLGYANGPGFSDHFHADGGRQNPRGMPYMAHDFRQPTTVPLSEETHSAEDVGVFASGPQSHLFSGVYEQSYIAHAISFALCIGPDNFIKHPNCPNSSSHPKIHFSLIIFIIFYSLFRLSHE